MASGVAVDQQCKDEFEKLKMKRAHRYIVYRLSDNLCDIIVEKTAARDATHDEFVADMTAAADKKQCRYVIYEVDYKKNDSFKSKLVFVYWGPEYASVKQKMIYSSSKEKFLQELGRGGISMVLQANDFSDLEKSEMEQKLLDMDKYM